MFVHPSSPPIHARSSPSISNETWSMRSPLNDSVPAPLTVASIRVSPPSPIAPLRIAASPSWDSVLSGYHDASPDIASRRAETLSASAGVISGKLYHVIARSFHISGRSVDVTSPIQPTLPAGTCDTSVRGVPQ